MAAEKGGETRSYQKSFSEVFSAITKVLEDLKIGVASKNEKKRNNQYIYGVYYIFYRRRRSY